MSTDGTAEIELVQIDVKAKQYTSLSVLPPSPVSLTISPYADSIVFASTPLVYSGTANTGFVVSVYWPIISSSFCYSPETLQYMGVDASTIPHDLNNLLDMLLAGYQNGQMDDVRLFDADQQDYTLICFVIEHYTNYYTSSGGILNHDTFLFKELIDKTDRIIQRMKTQFIPSASLPPILEHCSPDSKLYFHKYDHDASRIFLPLAPAANLLIKYPAYLTVYIVNLFLENFVNATLFLQSLFENMSNSKQLMLWPNLSAPVTRDDYEDQRNRIIQNMNDINSDITTSPASGAFKKRLEAYAADLAALEETSTLLSLQMIELYQSFAPSISVPSSLAWELPGGDDFSTLLQRYITGNMKWEQVISMLQQRYQMIHQRINQSLLNMYFIGTV